MAFDIFLKLTGGANVLIKGESVVKGHEKRDRGAVLLVGRVA